MPKLTKHWWSIWSLLSQTEHIVLEVGQAIFPFWEVAQNSLFGTRNEKKLYRNNRLRKIRLRSLTNSKEQNIVIMRHIID